ncbi:MAG: tRNA (adenosine(37)-N6)-dimethylallyltransferase MiaA, partial [Pseudomonadota bacterium]
MTDAILIAGPTASGKSALALRLAAEVGGAVINADSQQVYRNWRILTARPTREDEARVPHFLYGHLGLEEEYSVGHWLRDLEPVLDRCARDGMVPVITGGTGLYFKGLTEGLAPVPQTPPEVRSQAMERLAGLGLAQLAAELERRDPDTAAMTDLANSRRVMRAWEVLETTGRGLAEWQKATAPPRLALQRCDARVVLPARDV